MKAINFPGIIPEYLTIFDRMGSGCGKGNSYCRKNCQIPKRPKTEPECM